MVAARCLPATGNMRWGLCNLTEGVYLYSRSPQQALFGAPLGPCRGLCPTEGAKEAGMCQHNTS